MKCGCFCSILNNPYLRVIIKGLFSFSIIFGIYSWMSNVNKIQIIPDHTTDQYVTLIENGIACTSKNDGIPVQYCNTMTRQIINITITNSSNTQWQCALYTDYTNKKLYNISPFKQFMISFGVFAAISSIFFIIHDVTLVYHRHNLDKLISAPRKSDIHYSEKIRKAPHKLFHFMNSKLQNYSKCTQIILSILSVIPLFLLMIIFAVFVFFAFSFELFIWTMIIYPFYVLIKEAVNKKLDFSGFSYVSSMWLGLSSYLTTTATYLLVAAVILYDMDVSVPSLNSHKCYCSCNYILPEKTFYSFLLVDSLLAIANIKFLHDWCQESVHGEQFMYLINYSLPLFQATYINKDNPAGSMFNGKHLSNRNILSIDDEKTMPDYTRLGANDETNNEISSNGNVNTMTTFTVWWRVLVFVGGVGTLLLYSPTMVVIFGTENVYGYPKQISDAILWIGYIFLGCFAVSMCFAVVLFKYRKNNHSRRLLEVN